MEIQSTRVPATKAPKSPCIIFSNQSQTSTFYPSRAELVMLVARQFTDLAPTARCPLPAGRRRLLRLDLPSTMSPEVPDLTTSCDCQSRPRWKRGIPRASEPTPSQPPPRTHGLHLGRVRWLSLGRGKESKRTSQKVRFRACMLDIVRLRRGTGGRAPRQPRTAHAACTNIRQYMMIM